MTNIEDLQSSFIFYFTKQTPQRGRGSAIQLLEITKLRTIGKAM